MREINTQSAKNISALIEHSDVSVTEFSLEKDFHISAALRGISKIKNEFFDLVFCGGTCLVKAYGVLERLSEDVDIKVILKPGVVLGSNQLKKNLSKLKASVVEALVGEGFDREQFEADNGGEERPSIRARDINRYMTFNVRYKSHFARSDVMRKWLQVELNTTSLARPSQKLQVLSTFDQLAKVLDPEFVEMDCVDLTEAAVEKLVSFPRRLALYLRNCEATKKDESIRQRSFDQTLVRHIYDIYEISRLAPSAFENDEVVSDLIASVMKKDASDFKYQHPEFVKAPVAELEWAMASAASSRVIREAYERFLEVMVYGEQKPSFDDAMRVFRERMAKACEKHTKLSFYEDEGEPLLKVDSDSPPPSPPSPRM